MTLVSKSFKIIVDLYGSNLIKVLCVTNVRIVQNERLF